MSIGFRAIDLSAIVSRNFFTSVLMEFCSNKLKISDPGADINCGFNVLEKSSLLCLKRNSFVVSVHPDGIVIIDGCLTLIRFPSLPFAHVTVTDGLVCAGL